MVEDILNASFIQTFAWVGNSGVVLVKQNDIYYQVRSCYLNYFVTQNMLRMYDGN